MRGTPLPEVDFHPVPITRWVPGACDESAMLRYAPVSVCWYSPNTCRSTPQISPNVP